jgi:elongation factor 3
MSVLSPDVLNEVFSELSLNSKDDVELTLLVAHVSAEPRLVGPICSYLGTQVSSTDKKSEGAIANALRGFERLANECIVVAEPYLCLQLPTMLNAAAHKQARIRNSASAAVQAVTTKMSPNAVPEVLSILFPLTQVGIAWQTRALALKTIASFGDFSPEQLGFNLPQVIPEVTKSMSETKREVAAAALEAMTSACDVIGNRDIEHMTPKIVRSITNPEEVPEIMHALAGVTFVQSVQSPALAMVVPLLIRGLRSKLTATRRQSAVIIDNMSKLVDDPLDAAPFLPTLMPALAFAADAMSDPEARQVAENASNQLSRLAALCERARMCAKEVDHTAVTAAITAKIPAATPDSDIPIAHIGHMCCSLMSLRKFESSDWEEVTRYLTPLAGTAASIEATEALRVECKEMMKPLPMADDDDDAAELLCDCQFTLAYGTKILLHNTTMRLKRGAKYGLLGGNDSGKTTLMRSIANGSVEGFPDPTTVRTVFVEADILGELSHLSCVDYIMEDPRLSGIPREDVLAVMATVGFTDDGKAKPHHAVSTLSGGWRMKLALARAMLQRADILLLDEPTNHLDVINVAWVKAYINSLRNVTAIMVSHDSGFLNDCCTDILQIERLKLKSFRGNLDAFIAQNPEAKAYFSLKEAKLKFTFPQPGPIEGVKSRSKALMKMSHCDFTYPGNTTPTLFDISIQVSMASRVGCVGENGAGKSTMIKLLTGELVPQTGEVWKHPNARVAYVAQHAFHHIEQHLNKTPNEYIRWRYANGEDKESLVKVSMVLTEEEQRLQREPFEVNWKDEDGKVNKANKVVVELVGSRRENKQKEYEYEVKYRDGSEGYLSVKILARRGWEKATKAIDARIAQRSGLYIRTLSSANVEKHLGDCGLEAEFATHYRMSALSGGQKVKVVMAAAMWNQPHILILDEPTNYLDRESLGALANAIAEFQGGVVIISHNNEFVSTLCPEEWVMDAGHLTTRGEVGWMNRQDDKISDAPVITEMTDALGNTSEVKGPKKTLSKRDEKAAIKALKKKIDAGEELDEDEEELALKHNLL